MNQNKIKKDEPSISQLREFIGKKVEVIAFDISYRGILEEFDLEKGILKIMDQDDFVILEIERIESFKLIE